MSMVYALCCLLAAADGTAATSSSQAAGNARTIEILIAGPEGARRRMDETIRPLLEPDPDLRWASEEEIPTDRAFPEPGHAGFAQIWIDVSNPMRVRVYLPTGVTKGATTVRTLTRSAADGQDSDLLAREAVAQIVKAAVSALRTEPEQPTEAVTVPAGKSLPATVGRKPAAPKPEGTPRRRREGAFWLSLGGGMGWGRVPSGDVEWAKDENGQPIKVGAVTAMTGLFNLLPELGYMWSDNFSLSLQLRLEFLGQEQRTSTNIRSGEPESRALALFLRGLWFFDVSSDGSFQFFTGASAGAGYVRFPVTPDPNPSGGEIPDPNLTITKTDTRPMGVVLVGPDAGFIYHLSPHFGLSFDARALLGFPQLGFAIEGCVSALIALGGQAPRRSGNRSEAHE